MANQVNSGYNILSLYLTKEEQIYRRFAASSLRKKPAVYVEQNMIPNVQMHVDGVGSGITSGTIEVFNADTDVSAFTESSTGVQVWYDAANDRNFVIYDGGRAFTNLCGNYYLLFKANGVTYYSEVFRAVNVVDENDWYSITFSNTPNAHFDDFIWRAGASYTFLFKGYYTNEAPGQENEDITNGDDENFRAFDSVKLYQILRIMDVAPNMLTVFKALEMDKLSTVQLKSYESNTTYDLKQIEVAIEAQPASNPMSIVNLRWLDLHTIYRGKAEDKTLTATPVTPVNPS